MVPDLNTFQGKDLTNLYRDIYQDNSIETPNLNRSLKTIQEKTI